MAEKAPLSQAANGGLFHLRARGISVLAWTFLASLVIHGLLLFELRIVSWEARGRVVAPPLRGELQQSRPAEVEALVTESTRGLAPAKSHRPPQQRARSSEASSGARGGETPDSEQDSVSDELAPAALSEYRLALARAARRLHKESFLGSPHGLAGEVQLVLSKRLGSPHPLVEVVRTSGEALLDELALQLIGQAVKLVPLPVELSQRQVRIGLQVLFGPPD